MKKQTLFLLAAIIILAVSQQLQAQTYTGNLTLTTQAQVDAFNYTEVTGNLYIVGNDITDLSPLSNLVSVGGQLGIVNNTSLTTINGFSSLTTAGEILIYTNPVLQSFSDFHSLDSTFTGGSIDIYNNVSLTSFSGFEVLQTVGHSFEIGNNTVLTQIPDYPLLHTIASSLFIYDNPLLPEITGFNTLQLVGWAFVINENNALSRITGFKVLQSAGEYPWTLFNPPIIISDNDVLADFCGLYNFFNYNSGLYTGTDLVDISGNLVNPSIQDIINGGPCPLFFAFDDFTVDELKIEIDNFKIEGNFTLGAASNGIDPLTEDVTLEVDAFSLTIPAGSFETGQYGYEFEGDINGVGVYFEIHTLGEDDYYFEAEYEGVDLSGTTFPVDVTLTVGDESGTTSYSGELDKDGITKQGSELPIEFALDQNYPNPFNPTTQIRFGIPEAGNVTLKIYNSVGQLVKTLVNGNMSEGYHQVNWDATNNSGNKLSSGIYFYTLTSGSFVESKKMILMK